MTELTQVRNAMLNEEFLEILQELQLHHAIFYQLWAMGRPVFTDSLSTAAVSFDDSGKVLTFIMNPQFWDELKTLNEKLFIVAHECLHVILNHGMRCKNITDIANIAMDLVVNHMLVNRFGFNRKECDPQNRWCWIDTVFKNPKEPVRENESYEYYFNLLKDSQDAGCDSCGGTVADDHSGFSGNNFEDVLSEIGNKLSDTEKEELREKLKTSFENFKNSSAGNFSLGLEHIMPVIKPIKKKKWETVIKKWSLKYLTNTEKVNEQWARVNRRFVLMDNSFFIPTEMEIDEHEKDEKKIKVWFFQDTSGSCSGYITRFFKAALSLPKERFDVKMHCFDTSVYETTLESRKLYGFGGTSFSCIEAYIRRYCRDNKEKYPEAVFIITDGLGNNVTPEKPEKWYWFLTPRGYKGYISKESKIYDLAQFE